MYNSLSWLQYTASDYKKHVQQSVLATVSCIKSWKYVQQSVLESVSCVKSQEHAQQYVLATIPCIKLWKHIQTVCLHSSILCQFTITHMSICLGNNILNQILWWQLQRGFMIKCTKIHSPVPFTTTFEYHKHSLNNKIIHYMVKKIKLTSEIPTIFSTIQPTTVPFN